MNKSFFQRLFVIVIALPIILTACCTTKEYLPKEEPVEAWSQITKIEDLTGIWKTDSGRYYEYPFSWSRKTYLHFVKEETDDTAKWEACARIHGTTVQDLWNKRFAYVSEIYNINYPYALSSGTEFGVKLTYKNSRIYSTEEILIPSDVVAKNLHFFEISTFDNLREIGVFSFLDTTKQIMYSEHMLYKKTPQNLGWEY